MEIDIEVGAKLAASSERIESILKSSGPPKAFHVRRVQQGLATLNVPTILSFGRPSTGLTWAVVHVVIMGTDDHTVIPGTDCVIGIGDATNPSLAMVLEPSNGNTVPNSAQYGTDTIWCSSGDDLFVIVYGAVSGQSLTAIAWVDAYFTDDVEPKGSSR